jgi:hypothetical protein
MKISQLLQTLYTLTCINNLPTKHRVFTKIYADGSGGIYIEHNDKSVEPVYKFKFVENLEKFIDQIFSNNKLTLEELSTEVKPGETIEIAETIFVSNGNILIQKEEICMRVDTTSDYRYCSLDSGRLFSYRDFAGKCYRVPD